MRLGKYKLRLTDDTVFLFLVILCTFFVMGLVNFPNHANNVDLFQRRQNLAAKVEELQRQNILLEKEIAALKTDRYYVEAIARRKFLLVRPEEAIILRTQKARGEADSLTGSGSHTIGTRDSGLGVRDSGRTDLRTRKPESRTP
jgi:cell division protein FtsB